MNTSHQKEQAMTPPESGEEEPILSGGAPFRGGALLLLPVFALLIAILIRPQDWVSGLVGFPLVLIIILPALAIGIVGKIATQWSIRLPQNYFLIGFLVMVLLSDVMNGQADKGMEQIGIFAKRAAFYLICILLLDSMRKIRWVMDFMVGLSVILAIQGIDQFRTGRGWAGQLPYGLAQGYTENRINWVGDWDGSNGLALLFVVCLGICLEYFFGSTSFLRKMFALISSAFLLVGVYLTQSRGGYLALIAIALFYFRSRFKLRYAIPIGLLVLFMWHSYAPERMSGNMQSEESARERLWIWEQGLNLVQKYPIWGVGKGRFAQYSYEHLLAHNNYIQISAEVGLPGFFFWLAIMYFSIRGVFRLQRTTASKDDRIDIQVGRALLVAMIGFSAATMFITMELDFLFFLWGLCGAAVLASGQEWTEELKRVRMFDLGLTAGLVVAVLGLMHAVVTIY